MPKLKNSNNGARSLVKVSKAKKTSFEENSLDKSSSSKGRKKGFKKQSIEIKDSCIEPYYIICEDRQYIKMQKGNTLSQGYFTSLGALLRSIAKDLLLHQKAGSTLTLSQFISEYEQLQSKILTRLDI